MGGVGLEMFVFSHDMPEGEVETDTLAFLSSERTVPSEQENIGSCSGFIILLHLIVSHNREFRREDVIPRKRQQSFHL